LSINSIIRLSELEFEQAIDAKMLGIGSEGHDADRIAEELGLLYISYQAGCPSTNMLLKNQVTSSFEWLR